MTAPTQPSTDTSELAQLLNSLEPPCSVYEVRLSTLRPRRCPNPATTVITTQCPACSDRANDEMCTEHHDAVHAGQLGYVCIRCRNRFAGGRYAFDCEAL